MLELLKLTIICLNTKNDFVPSYLSANDAHAFKLETLILLVQ